MEIFSDSALAEETVQEGSGWLLEVAYDGTGFIGWQTQPQGATVQETVECALSKMYAGAEIRIRSSGRTDAGVHALGMAAAFDAPAAPVIPELKLLKALNRILPDTVRVRSLRPVPLRFDPRRNAAGKAYSYVVCRSAAPSPFAGRWSWHLPEFRHVEAAREAAAHLAVSTDFSSFAVKINKSGKNPLRSITRIDIQECGEFVCLTFIGKSFLYKMVRGIVGTLAFVGDGRLPPSEVARILEARDREAARDTAPAKGLFLVKVFFTDDEMAAFEPAGLPFHW